MVHYPFRPDHRFRISYALEKFAVSQLNKFRPYVKIYIVGIFVREEQE